MTHPPAPAERLHMKKILLLSLCCALALTAGAGNGRKALRKPQLNALITEYRLHDGFEVVNLGAVKTALLKSVIKVAALSDDNDDARKALRVIRHIRKIAVVDYSDCGERIRERFSRRAAKLLDGGELLMEVKDGSDIMKMYGVADEDGDAVRDFVLFSPGDCALICLFGSIPLQAVAELIDE